ncbi:Pex24p-domain-containing protein [Suhomyces tanzawaensis NRRL Y-17324]|uniref:Pex24p-domain-containing protein n=1 Tax=Suhomyces tanzawaensis NRRL Y-17324 TaxID=984487 RepID=A0A1E4SJR6_9ASCO|nr:Pex24p-domain-containing protein [Suhomyces tanzawaensis NRRL Y-17324]ODV79677.1 Pex24p-domain-containing protein [Suhomyces tanzawaensis NRRL Y-17324]
MSTKQAWGTEGNPSNKRSSLGEDIEDHIVHDDPEEEDVELRASFTTNNPFEPETSDSKPQTSPLLSATPPTVAKALIKAYPYLLIVNKLLSIATWTNDDYWINIIILSVFSLVVLYFENLIVWFGHIIIVGIITLYAVLNNMIVEETKLHPTLDDVVQALTATCIKADMLLNPITSLSLTASDIKRLLFTTLFLTPLYLIATLLIIKPKIILLVSGLYVLSYHSAYSRVTRRIIWKIKLARVICFYLTGLDFLQAKNHSLFAAAFAKVQKNAGFDSSSGNKPVRFTYVIYENQRRWLGVGWTSNLLSYERTPWTDEFLNESSSIETFRLPNTGDTLNNPLESSSKINGASWKWVDKTWRLDLTSDGAITLANNKRSKTTANPSADEGFIYYDNTWKKPSTEDSYSKYTRRRRWIRTAELVFNSSDSETAAPEVAEEEQENVEEKLTASGSSKREENTNARKRKSLRFAEPEQEGNTGAENSSTSHEVPQESDSLDSDVKSA